MVNNIDELITFIRNINLNPKTNAEIIKEITNKFPNLDVLFNQKENRNKLAYFFKEKLGWKPIDYYILNYFFDKLGAEFLIQNEYSVGKGKEKKWFLNNINKWDKFSNEVKDYIVSFIFEDYKGIPYVYLENCYKNMGNNSLIPLTGYITSKEILLLNSIVENNNDLKYYKIIQNKIQTLKKAIDESIGCKDRIRKHYFLTPTEREMLALLFQITRKYEFRTISLPTIYISNEVPPLMLEYPELDNNNLGKNNNEFSNRDRNIPETYEIESLLGVYHPKKEEIILFRKGIEWFSKQKSVDIKLLISIVLIHEISHWIMHKLPSKKEVSEWNTELYIASETLLHESWAQLLTYWVADLVKGEFKEVFEKLNNNQSQLYHEYKNFKKYEKKEIMYSLEKLRLMQYPVSVNIWEKFLN